MIEFWVGLRSHHRVSLRTVLQVPDTAMGITLETSGGVVRYHSMGAPCYPWPWNRAKGSEWEHQHCLDPPPASITCKIHGLFCGFIISLSRAN